MERTGLINDRILYEVTRPGRYTGGEWNSIVKHWDKVPIKVALAFPDVYEVGMSNLALPILYKILNEQPDVLAERVFAPWLDMEAKMREHHIPLFSLESKRPLREFDIVGFSLGYELTYTNVLNMLDLAGIPVRSRERDGSCPLVIAGGSCVFNPEPMADFIDLFIIGEAEEAILKFLEVYRAYRGNKEQLLQQAARLPGVYVPAFYRVVYNKTGAVAVFEPLVPEAGLPIERQIVARLPYPVTKPVVPYIRIVHDRGAVEIQRGCTRGCRFCQAGVIYRPIRELPGQEVVSAVDEIISNCGYNEVTLVSLSSSDYRGISGLVDSLARRYSKDMLTISLPSLRLDVSAIGLIEALPRKHKTTITFAPEAGTERLRQVINKGISEDGIMGALAAAFEREWLNVKLYFMLGLPTETMDDVKGIVDLVQKAVSMGRRLRGRNPAIKVSVAAFVPKAHTPCQWIAQDTVEQLLAKHGVVKYGVQRAGAQFSWQDVRMSLLEAVFSRGDRRLGDVIYRAWQLGCKFDAWQECFNYGAWLRAFEEGDLAPAAYANREYALDEVLPWQHIDTGVTVAFLKSEYENMRQGGVTPDCSYARCNVCGLHRWYPDCQRRAGEAKQTL